jgi:hypothetical protein
MTFANYVTVVLVTVAILGCGPKTLSQRAELQALIDGVQGHQSGFWVGAFYCGTKGRYHYIVHRMQLGKTWLRIPTNELVVLDPFPFTSDTNRFVDISQLKVGDVVRAGPTAVPVR